MNATGQSMEERAYDLIMENGWEEHGRFPVLAAAWPAVAPALTLFAAGSNERLQSVCDALTAFLEFTGRWDEWLVLSHQAEVVALAAGDFVSAGWRAEDAGSVHYLRQQGDEVLACAERAYRHWTKAKAGSREQATALLLRARGHELKKDFPAALADALSAVELLRASPAESEDVAICLNDVAEIERRIGDFQAAERDYREALRIARRVGYAEGMAYITGNLAEMALIRKKWKGAETLALQALRLSKKVGRMELMALDHHCLAEALLRQNRRKEALPHAQQAVALFTQLGSPDLAAAQATLQECQA